jgi:FtsP/CotA-like multicopper oxidase with cupredoxin domain
VDRGPAGELSPEVVVGTLVVGGAPVEQATVEARLKRPAARPLTINPRPDVVRALAITGRRTIQLGESADGLSFSINGRPYDENRTDVTVHVGDVEEWTNRNPTSERHVFHIHQSEFLVESVNGAPPDFPGLLDTVDVPYAKDGKPGVVKVVIPFTNPRLAGTFVFHCNLSAHEDGGMMANIRVLPKPTLAEDAWNGLRRLAGLSAPAEAADESAPAGLTGGICSSPAAGTE